MKIVLNPFAKSSKFFWVKTKKNKKLKKKNFNKQQIDEKITEENVNEITSTYFSLFSITESELNQDSSKKDILKNKKLSLSEIRNATFIGYDDIDFDSLLKNEKPLYAHPEKVLKKPKNMNKLKKSTFFV